MRVDRCTLRRMTAATRQKGSAGRSGCRFPRSSILLRIAFGCAFAALLLAPLTVVQPCLASGLILLLWLGATRLGERPGLREGVAVAAIVVGVVFGYWVYSLL